jgi:hypothetical protein
VAGVALFGAASAALFGPALFSDQALLFRDILHYYWPAREAVAASLRAGELPLWDPSHSGGLPLLADLHAAALYPPNLLHLLLPFPRAYALLLVLHQVAGALGVAALARRLGAGGPAALAGGLAYMLSGYVVSLHLAGPLMAGSAYVPWVLVAASSGAAAPRRVAAVALLCALQALTGDPQSVLFSALALALALLWAFQGARPGALAVLAGAGLLAALLAAVQLLPAWELLQHSTRGVRHTPGARDWTLLPVRLAELVLPLPFGEYLEAPRFWLFALVEGPSPAPFALSIYLGASCALLALLGLQRRRAAGLAVSLVLLGALLALGAHAGLAGLLERVPPFRFFRYPEKYLLLTSLGWALLVALGLERALSPGALPRRRLWAAGGAAGLLLAGLLVAQLAPAAALGAMAALMRALGQTFPPDAPLAALEGAASAALVAAAAMALGLLLLRRKPDLPVLVALPLLVLAADLVQGSRRTVWTDDIALFQETPLAVERMRERGAGAPFRVLRDTATFMAVLPGARDGESLSLLRAWELVTLKSNLGGLFGLEEVWGYTAAEQWRPALLREALASQPLRWADALNGCFVLTAEPPPEQFAGPGLVSVLSLPQLRLALLERERCVPRLHGVRRVLAADAPRAAARTLAATAGLDLGVDAVVEGEPPARFEGPLAVVRSEVGRAGAVAEVEAPPGGGFLVFAATWYPAWQARVDGAPVPLRAVNVATMGVRVPEGRHRVEFRYEDRWAARGAALSALGLAVAVLLLLLPALRRRE